jgi:glycosyltransferase involved in cell wall biosynthesis
MFHPHRLKRTDLPAGEPPQRGRSVTEKKPVVCIVSMNAYGTLSGGGSRGHIGGIEWQTVLTAKWLAAHGCSVSLVTWDEGGPAEETVDGVRIIKTCRKNAGVKGVRFFYPKWVKLNDALRRAVADLYYQNGAECTTGQVAWWCRRNGKPFVFAAASNMDCMKPLPEIGSGFVALLYRYGLRTAQERVVQTQTQQRMLLKNFSVTSRIIPMPCDGIPENRLRDGARAESRSILWVGRVCRVKRPHLFLDMAEKIPGMRFDIVGPVSDGDPYSREIHERGKAIANVTFHGGVAREKVTDFYLAAFCLCCTSEVEGFPNTFLEAWSAGLPVVSTFDPDDSIAAFGMGLVASDSDGLVSCVKELRSDREGYRRMSRNARRYFETNHKTDTILPRFDRLFAELRQHNGGYSNVKRP